MDGELVVDEGHTAERVYEEGEVKKAAAAALAKSTFTTTETKLPGGDTVEVTVKASTTAKKEPAATKKKVVKRKILTPKITVKTNSAKKSKDSKAPTPTTSTTPADKKQTPTAKKAKSPKKTPTVNKNKSLKEETPTRHSERGSSRMIYAEYSDEDFDIEAAYEKIAYNIDEPQIKIPKSKQAPAKNNSSEDVTISKAEFDRLKAIEKKYSQIQKICK